VKFVKVIQNVEERLGRKRKVKDSEEIVKPIGDWPGPKIIA